MQELSVVWELFVKYFPAIVGFFMPVFIKILNRDVKSDTGRVWVSLLACFVVAVALEWQQLQYGSVSELEKTFGIIFVESHVVYKTWFKNSLANTLLDTLFEPKLPDNSGPESNASIPERG